MKLAQVPEGSLDPLLVFVAGSPARTIAGVAKRVPAELWFRLFTHVATRHPAHDHPQALFGPFLQELLR